MLVFDLNDQLRVVELLKLGRHGEPEARSAAADKCGHEIEYVAIRLTVFLRNLPDDHLGAAARFVP